MDNGLPKSTAAAAAADDEGNLKDAREMALPPTYPCHPSARMDFGPISAQCCIFSWDLGKQTRTPDSYPAHPCRSTVVPMGLCHNSILLIAFSIQLSPYCYQSDLWKSLLPTPGSRYFGYEPQCCSLVSRLTSGEVRIIHGTADFGYRVLISGFYCHYNSVDGGQEQDLFIGGWDFAVGLSTLLNVGVIRLMFTFFIRTLHNKA